MSTSFHISEDIALQSKEVIVLQESLLPIPCWKRYGVLVDRIIDLIQRLRTLAQAQRNEEVSTTIRLICGYLSFIDTWNTPIIGISDCYFTIDP